MGEGNLIAIGIGTVYVVEADGYLCKGFQCGLASLKDFGVDGITQRSDETVDAGLYFVNNQTLRRRFRLGIDLDFIAAAAQ